jgi:hypothetical protein
MTKVKILFDTGFELAIKLNNNSFIQRWTDLLADEISTKEILQVDTFSSFFSKDVSIEYLTSAINKVNSFLKVDFVPLPKDSEINSQDYYNLLHSKFEKLAGSDWSKPTKLMVVAPQEIQLAIKQINRFCHRLEQRPYKIESWLRVEFNTSRRELLLAEDYNLFEPIKDANIVYLDYSTLGKSMYECYQDGLDPTYSGLKIQEHYCANFVMLFDHPPAVDKDKFNQWLKQYNVDTSLLKSSGAIPLGKIEDNNALQSVLKSRKINKITLEKNDGKTI